MWCGVCCAGDYYYVQTVDVNGPSAPYTVVNIEHPGKDEIEMWVKVTTNPQPSILSRFVSSSALV